MAREPSRTRRARAIPDPLSRANITAKASTSGPMELTTSAAGMKASCTAMARTPMLTAENGVDTSSMVQGPDYRRFSPREILHSSSSFLAKRERHSQASLPHLFISIICIHRDLVIHACDSCRRSQLPSYHRLIIIIVAILRTVASRCKALEKSVPVKYVWLGNEQEGVDSASPIHPSVCVCVCVCARVCVSACAALLISLCDNVTIMFSN